MRVVGALVVVFGLFAASPSSIKEYFEKLAADPNATVQPEQLAPVCEQIPAASVLAITEVLPTLQRMLKTGGEAQRGAAAMAFFSVVRRTDGTQLLKSYVPDIVASLRDPHLPVARVAALTLSNLYPPPVEQVVPQAVAFIGDDHADEGLRAALLGVLAEYSPNDPRVVDAITAFMRGKHPLPIRDNALNAIANAQQRGYSPALVALIIESVENDPETRFTSVQALGRCGLRAAGVAIPVLSKVASDEHETPEVRKMAESAIDMIHHSAR